MQVFCLLQFNSLEHIIVHSPYKMWRVIIYHPREGVMWVGDGWMDTHKPYRFKQWGRANLCTCQNTCCIMVASLISLMATLVTTSRVQQCFDVLIDICHEFLFLFFLFCSVGNKTYYYYYYVFGSIREMYLSHIFVDFLSETVPTPVYLFVICICKMMFYNQKVLNNSCTPFYLPMPLYHVVGF